VSVQYRLRLSFVEYLFAARYHCTTDAFVQFPFRGFDAIIWTVHIVSHRTLSDLISTDLVLSEPGALRLVTATANWVVHCEATKFVVAYSNHSAVSPDENRNARLSLAYSLRSVGVGVVLSSPSEY